MVSSIPGSSFLTSALDVISQSLQIPVIVFLLLFAVISVIILGGLISEYTSRKKVSMKTMRELIYDITESNSISEMKEVISSANIPKSQRRVLDKIASSSSLILCFMSSSNGVISPITRTHILFFVLLLIQSFKYCLRSFISALTSSCGRFQFSVENAYTVR